MNKQNLEYDHINIAVKNFNKTINWYKEMFDFDLVESGLRDDGDKWGIIRKSDIMICFTERKNYKKQGEAAFLSGEFQINHIGIRLSDKKIWENHIKENQVPLYYGSPVGYKRSTSWYVKDPSGHEIEVSYWNNNKISF